MTREIIVAEKSKRIYFFFKSFLSHFFSRVTLPQDYSYIPSTRSSISKLFSISYKSMFSKLQSHTALSKIRLYIFQTAHDNNTKFQFIFQIHNLPFIFQNFPNRPFHISKFSCFEIIKLRRKMRFAKKRKKKFPNFNTGTREYAFENAQ